MQAAINAAGSGGTVVLAANTSYTLPGTLSLQNLALTGSHSELVGGAVRVGGRFALRGVTIRNAVGNGLTVANGAIGTVENVVITHSRDNGIETEGTTGCVAIMRSTIRDNGAYGIVNDEVDNTMYLTNNLVTGNGTRSMWSSGFNGYIKTGVFSGNTFSNNGVNCSGSGYCHGIYIDYGQDDSGVVIEYNTLIDQPNGAGLLAKSSATIRHNTITGNVDTGLEVGQNSDPVTYQVYGNVITGNGGHDLVEHLKGSNCSGADCEITLHLHDNTIGDIYIGDDIVMTGGNNQSGGTGAGSPPPPAGADP
ncbi:MAG: right-handed parallel beta-helix repeat-containing protein [Deltaproteobacteria bacterium]|nr:right-handed parallel beta-helix repeat-containing protein [Deltaproteobacteria bacterium]